MGNDSFDRWQAQEWAPKMIELFRCLRDSRIGLVARLVLACYHAKGQQRLVDKWSAQLGIPALEIKQLPRKNGTNSTLFILGSGESVENLGPREFAHIAEHFSIGINAWPLHPFVADVYAFEPFDTQSVDYMQLFNTVLREGRFMEKKPEFLLFRPHNQIDAERYLRIPEELRENAHLYGRFVPITVDKKTLFGEVKALNWLRRRNLLGPSLVMDLGATVIRMVTLGLLLEYQNIVLIGVDLNGGKYFWERNPHRLRQRGLASFSPGHNRGVHETMTRGEKAFVLTEVLAQLQRLATLQGKTLSVGSASSLLAEFLPVYAWESEKSPS